MHGSVLVLKTFGPCCKPRRGKQAHCPDTSLLPPSDSRGHNSSNSTTLQAGVAEGTEADRGRDNR